MDLSVSAGGSIGSGAESVIEIADVIAATLNISSAGSGVPFELPDQGASSGALVSSGSSQAPEGNDSAVISGLVASVGLAANQETFDTIAAVGVGQLSAIGQASVVESFDNSSVLAGISIAADSRYVLTGVAINYTVTGNTSQALVAAGSSNYVIAPTAPFTVKA